MTTLATATQIPTGHSFEITYDAFRPRLTFISDTQLEFEILSGFGEGMTETVDYQAILLRPGLFAVSWQEKSNNTVVHVEDFAKGTVHAHITLADGTFMRMSGPISNEA